MTAPIRPSDGNIARFEKPVLLLGIVATAVYALVARAVDVCRRWTA